jgi:hypothetical protein
MAGGVFTRTVKLKHGRSAQPAAGSVEAKYLDAVLALALGNWIKYMLAYSLGSPNMTTMCGAALRRNIASGAGNAPRRRIQCQGVAAVNGDWRRQVSTRSENNFSEQLDGGQHLLIYLQYNEGADDIPTKPFF